MHWRLTKFFRELLCRHTWQVSRYQALNAPPNEISYRCTKCGKYKHVTRPAAKESTNV